MDVMIPIFYIKPFWLHGLFKDEEHHCFCVIPHAFHFFLFLMFYNKIIDPEILC